MIRPAVIVITGASSGLGTALAAAYARPGVTLGLQGRDAQRLATVASACIAKGAVVKTAIMDVRNKDGMRKLIQDFDKTHPIDLLIANAGISAGTLGTMGESEQQVRDIFAVNVDGVFNSVLPAIPLMQLRKRGQIAIISSLAGIRGLPSCPAYSASKNAVRAMGEGLRGTLKDNGIEVTVVCPGYIKTPMTDVNNFPMPLLMSAEKAAEVIVKGLAKNRSRVAFPLALYLPLLLISYLPLWITDPFFAALPRKTAMEKK